jgi:hypothetical protein
MPVTTHLRMQWPSAAVSLPTFARHLVTLANEIHFVEIGLDAAPASRFAAAKDTVSSVRRALEDAMETDAAQEQEEIAARLSALLHALDDDGLSLEASVEQRTVEGADGVRRIDVLSIVVEQRAPCEPQVAAAGRQTARSFA